MLKRVLSLVIILSIAMTFISFPIAAEAEEGGLADNLVLWYKFDETEGTVVRDSSGNNNNGALLGDATWSTEGKMGGSVRLGGSDGYVSMPEGIVSNLDDITVAMWVKMESTSSYLRLFDFGTGTSVNMFLTPSGLNEGAVGLAFAITTSGWQEEERMEKGTPLDTNVWKHVAVVLSGDTGFIYEDGVEVARGTITLNPSDLGNTTNNYIGKSQYSSDPYFRGNFDDFRIYSKALSAAQIKALYEGSEGPAPTIISIDSVEVTTAVGKAPVLPATVTAKYSDQTSSPVEVVWDAIDPAKYAEPGTFEVEGTVAGTDIKAKAIVTVIEKKDFDISVTFNGDSLVPNQLLEAKVKVENKSEDYEGSALAIVAIYDKDGKMVNVSYVSKKILPQKTETLSAGFKLPANVEGYEVRVFVWEGTNLFTSNMKPLSDVVILK
ncbi:MAG: hypothetical protein GX066_09615 [Clostridiaceae bacterium]|nr:hypothetical protein [Clostridiaceae bacterium]